MRPDAESQPSIKERIATDYYQQYAVGTLAASIAARQVKDQIRRVDEQYIGNLERIAFKRLKRANRRLASVQISPVSEAEFVADALLLHLAHQEEIRSFQG